MSGMNRYPVSKDQKAYNTEACVDWLRIAVDDGITGQYRQDCLHAAEDHAALATGAEVLLDDEKR